jgi:hypothetical protein
MSLIRQQTIPTVADKIAMANSGCLGAMKNTARHTFNLFWNNPDHTPQEVADQLGTSAGLGFVVHSQLQTLIYTLDNSWVPLVPPHPYVTNQDGTVTVTMPEPEIPEGE